MERRHVRVLRRYFNQAEKERLGELIAETWPKALIVRHMMYTTPARRMKVFLREALEQEKTRIADR